MVDFTAFELVSTTAHLACRCPAGCIGFGSARMVSMTSSLAKTGDIAIQNLRKHLLTKLMNLFEIVI